MSDAIDFDQYQTQETFECDNSCGTIVYEGEWVSIVNGKLICRQCVLDLKDE